MSGQAAAWQRGLVWSWSLAVAIGLGLTIGGRGFDDPYVTYRYAEQIAAGHGMVYNLGERVLSTTSPLYALLLVPGIWLGLAPPLFSLALGSTALVAGGLALWRLGQQSGTPLVGAAGLLLYPLFPGLIETLGIEMVVQAAFILWAAVAWHAGRVHAAASLLALATLLRADALLAVPLWAGLRLFECWQAGQRGRALWAGLPWSALWLYLGLLLPWIIFGLLYFGSPIPTTLATKQIQGQMAISQDFLLQFGTRLLDYWALWPYRFLIGAALIGLWSAFRQPGWRLLSWWGLLYTLAYGWLGVSAYFWYYVPPVIVVLIAASHGCAIVGRWLAARLPAPAQRLALVGLLILPLLQIPSVIALAQTHDPRLGLNRAAGEWLAANSAPDAKVGTLEVGIIGYYAQRPIVDFAGLIQPEVALALTPDATYNDAAQRAFTLYQPDYLVVRIGSLDGFLANVAEQCKPQIRFFSSSSPTFQLMIYRC